MLWSSKWKLMLPSMSLRDSYFHGTYIYFSLMNHDKNVSADRPVFPACLHHISGFARSSLLFFDNSNIRYFRRGREGSAGFWAGPGQETTETRSVSPPAAPGEKNGKGTGIVCVEETTCENMRTDNGTFLTVFRF